MKTLAHWIAEQNCPKAEKFSERERCMVDTMIAMSKHEQKVLKSLAEIIEGERHYLDVFPEPVTPVIYSEPPAHVTSELRASGFTVQMLLDEYMLNNYTTTQVLQKLGVDVTSEAVQWLEKEVIKL